MTIQSSSYSSWCPSIAPMIWKDFSSKFSNDLFLRLPTQNPPPKLLRYLLLAIATPIPIPIAVPMTKDTNPTQSVGLITGPAPGAPITGCWAGTTIERDFFLFVTNDAIRQLLRFCSLTQKRKLPWMTCPLGLCANEADKNNKFKTNIVIRLSEHVRNDFMIASDKHWDKRIWFPSFLLSFDFKASLIVK